MLYIEENFIYPAGTHLIAVRFSVPSVIIDSVYNYKKLVFKTTTFTLSIRREIKFGMMWSNGTNRLCIERGKFENLIHAVA